MIVTQHKYGCFVISQNDTSQHSVTTKTVPHKPSCWYRCTCCTWADRCMHLCSEGYRVIRVSVPCAHHFVLRTCTCILVATQGIPHVQDGGVYVLNHSVLSGVIGFLRVVRAQISHRLPCRTAPRCGWMPLLQEQEQVVQRNRRIRISYA